MPSATTSIRVIIPATGYSLGIGIILSELKRG